MSFVLLNILSFDQFTILRVQLEIGITRRYTLTNKISKSHVDPISARKYIQSQKCQSFCFFLLYAKCYYKVIQIKVAKYIFQLFASGSRDVVIFNDDDYELKISFEYHL